MNVSSILENLGCQRGKMLNYNRIKSVIALLNSVINLYWNIFLSLMEWIVPNCWCAKDVDQDIVLITGAGSGLGREIAVEFARLNSNLILWDINQKGLEETKALVHKEFAEMKKASEKQADDKICLTYIVDVSDRTRVQEAAHQVNSDLNARRGSDEPDKYVSVLVNNAGIYHGLMLQDLKDEQIERIFNINILAHFWTVRAFLPQMIKHEKGHIVEIASMGGISGLLKQVDYCATKFATVGFEESLNIELDHMGLSGKIHTTVICPFFFSSNLFSGFDTSNNSLMSPEYVAKQTVIAMRCNHSRIMLPKLSAYYLFVMKTFMTRKVLIEFTKDQGLAKSIKEIRGHAVKAT